MTLERRLARDARAIFARALAAVKPEPRVEQALRSLALEGPVDVLAVGKAAAGMARGAARELGRRRGDVLVVLPRGYPAAVPPRARVAFAPHPEPGPGTLGAVRQARRFVGRRRSGSWVLLLSGGASALLSAPRAGLCLADLRAVTRLLLRASVPIDEVNRVRRVLLELADGRLLEASAVAPAAVLLLSDVPGDRPETIGSGPGLAAGGSAGEAARVLARHHLLTEVPARVRAWLERLPPDASPQRVPHRIVGRLADAMRAAAREAERRGYRVLRSRTRLQGEAALAGSRLALRLLRVEGSRPCCLLAGGETTVSLGPRPGEGGRSQELALAAAVALSGTPGVGLLAAGTDGIDGRSRAAGAWADGHTLARGRRVGRSAVRDLSRHDSTRFFRAAGGLLVTGPTGTNVGDLVIGLAHPPKNKAALLRGRETRIRLRRQRG